ncbi:MAG: hypothetical protein ACLFPA_10500 [Dichotomicrobium sp.]
MTGTTETPARERFDGAALWAQLTEDEQREIGALALEYTVNCLGEDQHAEQPGVSPASRPFEEGNIVLMDALLAATEDALVRLKPFAAQAQAEGTAAGGAPIPIPSRLGPVCRVCGCTEHDACPEGCGWAEADLCTSCAGQG